MLNEGFGENSRRLSRLLSPEWIYGFLRHLYSRTSQGSTGENMITMKPGVSLLSIDGAAATTLDGEDAIRVLRCSDVGEVHIEGFMIIRGFCPPSICYDFRGGGIYSTGSSSL